MKKQPKLFIFSLIIIGILSITGCNKEDTGPVPILTTSEVEDILNISATCGGTITSDGGSTILAKGVCWSTKTDPTVSDSKTNDGITAESFTSILTGLTYNTTYFVRAYATNSNGTGYGNTLSFITLNIPPTVTDIDGNIYHTVIIGSTVWMVENLKTTKYRNGDPIPNVTDKTTWATLSTGAYCNYNNDANNALTYGRLYNWGAVNDSRQLAPLGWHVATEGDWIGLVIEAYFNNEGGKLKETGTSHWQSPNTGATNELGFTALPGGYRSPYSGEFSNIGVGGFWWTSSENGINFAWFCTIGYNSDYLLRDGGSYGQSKKTSGLSVRCVMD